MEKLHLDRLHKILIVICIFCIFMTIMTISKMKKVHKFENSPTHTKTKKQHVIDNKPVVNSVSDKLIDEPVVQDVVTTVSSVEEHPVVESVDDSHD